MVKKVVTCTYTMQRLARQARITSPALMKTYDAPEDWDRFEKKLLQKEKELNERQAKAEAQAAYLRGEKVDLLQWERAAIEEIKRELADKKIRDAAKKSEKDAEAAKEKLAAAAMKANLANKGSDAIAEKKDVGEVKQDNKLDAKECQTR